MRNSLAAFKVETSRPRSSGRELAFRSGQHAAAVAVPAPPPFRHVLFPLTASQLAAGLLPPVVLAFARAQEARLTLLRIVRAIPTLVRCNPVFTLEYTPWIPDEDATDRLVDNVMADLNRFANRISAAECLSVDARVVVEERVDRGIVNFANAERMDVVVLTAPRRGLVRRLLGSTADRVARSSRIPVLLVSG